jgi:hypothetical protein
VRRSTNNHGKGGDVRTPERTRIRSSKRRVRRERPTPSGWPIVTEPPFWQPGQSLWERLARASFDSRFGKSRSGGEIQRTTCCDRVFSGAR